MILRTKSKPGMALVRRLLMGLLLVAGLQQLGSAAMIQAKAQLAQRLIASAWEKTLDSRGQSHKPWPWADTWPVARLQVPKHQVDFYVLWGAGGNALAFGPGYETASAPLGRSGTAVIGGHRDTHFEFLKNIKANTLLSLQLPTGKLKVYRVAGTRIVDTNREPFLLTGADRNELLLVTCYPFDALISGGPLRYVVTASPLFSL